MQKIPTKKELEQKINQQKIINKTLFYTLVMKQRAITGSLYRKDIIMIFCPEDNSLFYVNQDHKLPFVDEKNFQKTQIKDIAQVTKSTFNNPSGTNQLIITYPKADQKGKQTTLQWRFDLANTGIAQLWAEMLNRYKQQRLKSPVRNSAIRNIVGPTSVSPVNNTSSVVNNTGTQKLDPQQIQKENHINFLLTDSRAILNKPDEFTTNVMNSYLRNTNNNNSKVNPSATIVSPTSSEILVPSPPPPSSTVTFNNNNSNPMMVPPSKPPNQQQSRLSYAYEMTSRVYNMQDSRVKPDNESKLANDWNYKFVQQPTRETVLEFEKYAFQLFNQIYTQTADAHDQLIAAQLNGCYVQIVDNFTSESKRLKREYRNYHYILESCKIQPILSVPLACLIQHLGCVCLVKAVFPKQSIKIKNKRQIENYLTDLQHKTKISNSILFYNSCQFYDLTKIYGSYGDAPRIYVDNLDEYMPEFNTKKKQQDEDNTFYVRPQLLQFLQSKIVPGGSVEDQKNSKIKNQFSAALQSQIKDIADCLSAEQIYITNIFDLKEFLHYRGVNLKFLYQVYQQTKNKFVKKYLLTCLVAKLIKDEINYGLSIVAKQSKMTKPQEYVQEQIRLFIQGKTAATNQCWKKLSIQYRSLYGSSINTHELIGGFLLSCLMTLIPAQYKLQSLDKQKVIFKDQGIIQKGFVHRLKPKIKSYYRFSTKIVQTVQICKYSQQNQDVFKRLVQYMNLKSKPIPQSYNVNNSRPYILGYLSDFVIPEGMGQQTLPCARQIYSLVNEEPPSTPTLKVTLNYIKQCLILMKGQKNKGDQKFQQLIRDSVQIINYWLQFQHPKICDFYQKVSIYEQLCGDTEQSLKILEKAIDVAYKTQAKNSQKIGMRHFVTGCQYLKAGRKKQAIDNLQKAKLCMEKTQGQQSQYALVLLKLSSLQLNNGDTDTCIRLGKQAYKNAQKGKMNDTYTIKICQILCRAYQIKGEKEQLRKLSANCAKQFNKTQQKSAFSEMVKICLTGTIAKLTVQRSKALVNLAYRLKDDNAIKDQNKSVNLLMDKARSAVVMQVFLNKSQSVDRYLSELVSKKHLSNDGNQFMSILAMVAGCVGVDFIEGLHAQKQFE